MKITEIHEKDRICVPLKATEKTDAIIELVDLLHARGDVSDRDEALNAILAREETRSTGIGLGLAVPHGKTRACGKLVMAVGKPAEPLEFNSADGRPCTFVVLLASPVDQTGPHIQALAHISRLWQTESFRRAVALAETPDDLYAAIERHQE